MKSFEYALLIGAATAVSLNDAPPYFNEPTWNELHPSAAGFVQLSSCNKAGNIAGVECYPSNSELFATGMNGDEDLGQDITMKGEPYHYQQKKKLAQGPPYFNEPAFNSTMPAAAGFAQKKFATGMNGDEDLGQDITMKGEPYHYQQKKGSASDAPPFFNEPAFNSNMPAADGFAQKKFATGMNGDEDLGQDITMKGEPYHYQQKKGSASDAPPFFNEPAFNSNMPAAAGFAQKRFATGMNGDEDLGQDITMKGEPYHYQQKKTQGPPYFNEPAFNSTMPAADGFVQSKFATGVTDGEILQLQTKDEAKDEEKPDLSPEKLSILETTKGTNHRTFYAQKK